LNIIGNLIATLVKIAGNTEMRKEFSNVF